MKYTLLSILYLYQSLLSINIRGLNPSLIPYYSGKTFTCDTNKVISISSINDNYCDCLDGTDEIGTSACSNSKFYCIQKGYIPKIIYSSNVDDDICDCCDGSDELYKLCENTCDVLGNTIKEKYVKRLVVVKEGIFAKQAAVEKAKEVRRKRLEDIAVIKVEVEQKQAEFDQVDVVVKKVEAEERELREIEKIILAEEAAKFAAENPTAPSSEEAPAAEVIDSNTELKSEPEAATENFPYPPEYAAPEKASVDKLEETASFPYPAEYAAPTASTEAVEEHNEEESPSVIQDVINSIISFMKKSILGEEATPVEKTSLELKTEELNKVRIELSGKRSTLDNSKRSLSDLEKAESINFGPDSIFEAFYKECFKLNFRHYVYEVCLFGDSAQKEGHSSTSLGSYTSWVDGFSSMKFENGATCWQGPARSLQIKFICGKENIFLSVDEPSKCVYTGEFSTPAACTDEMVAELETKINSPFTAEHLKDEL